MAFRPLAPFGVVALAAILAAGACSRASSTKGAEARSMISLAQWSRAADKICASANNTLAGAAADVDPLDPDLTKAQLDDAADLIDDLADRLDASVTDFNALDAPEDEQEAAGDLIDATQTAADDFSAAAEVGSDGDLGEFKRQVKSGAQALDDAAAAAKKLELEQCGDESGVGASTTTSTTTSSTTPTTAPTATTAGRVPGV